MWLAECIVSFYYSLVNLKDMMWSAAVSSTTHLSTDFSLYFVHFSLLA